MIKTAIDRILELSGIHVTEIAGRKFSLENLKPVVLDNEYEPDVLVLHTLDGLLDYAQSLFIVDQHCAAENARFHIFDYNRVDLIGPLQHRNKNTRFRYATADLLQSMFPFGSWLTQEQMIIELMTKFVPDEATHRLIGKVAVITEVSERVTEDDKASQIVKLRQGLRLQGEGPMENPITLRPWRTFREIEQPASEFIIRLKNDRRDGGVKLAIVEADGAAWKLQAIESIREYMQGRMYDWGGPVAVLGVIS